MINKKLAAGLAAALASAAFGSSAQTTYVRPAYQFPTGPAAGPANVQLGDTPLFFTPYVGVGAGYDDNLLLSSDNRKASTVYVFSPGFRLEARDPNKVIQLGYQAQIGRYGQSDGDDYVDQSARAQFDVALDRRNYLRFGLDYIRGHDPRGSTDRPISGSPDKYRLVLPSVTYSLGSAGAPGRLEAYYNEGDRRYLNNRSITEFSDRKAEEFGGAFYWRVLPRTHLLAEARRTNIRYHTNTRTNSREDRVYGGVTWEATAATTGTIKAGRVKKRFENDDSSTSSPSWEAIVNWAPRTYSKVDFYTARQTNESTGLGRFLLTSIGGITWTHAWSSYLSTGIDARYTKDEYQGFDRTDDTASLGLRAGYKFRRWLTLGAEYTRTQRDSNLRPFDYDKNLYLLTATASM
jgi:hypothetical protein